MRLCSAKPQKHDSFCHLYAFKQLQNTVYFSLGNDQSLECVDKFCYLSDMIAAPGGAEEVYRARVRCAWAKFRELAPILTPDVRH